MAAITTEIAPQTETGEQLELTQAPEEKDPYFIRDGKPFTGAKAGQAEPAEPPEAEKDEDAEGDEAKAAPEAEKEPAEDEKAKKKSSKDPEEALAHGFASLKKQKRLLAQREREAERRLAEAAQRAERYERITKLYQDDPYSAARELGLDFRRIVEHVAKEGDQDPTQKALAEANARIAALDAKLAEFADERKQASQAEVVQGELTMLQERIEGAAEEFPYLAAYGADRAARAVHSAWYAHLHATGEHLDVAALFEQYEDELREDAARLARLQKPAEATASPARKNGAVQSAKPGARSDAPSTLSNRTTAQRASTDRPKTREERLAAAAAMLELRD